MEKVRIVGGESRKKVGGFFTKIFIDSNLHGVKYLGLPNRHIVERLFWWLSVLACLAYSFYLVAEVVRKYNENPIIISFQPKETSVAQIPFPAVTICNVNILKTTAMREVFDNLNFTLVNGNYTYSLALEEYIVLSEYLSHHCLAAPSFRRLLQETLIDANGDNDFVDILNEFLLLNYVITDRISADAFEELYKEKTINFSRYAAPHCEDMILRCMWENQFILCKDFFFPIATQHGVCCVFNMMPRFILKNLSINETRVKREMDDLPDGAVKQWKKFKEKDLIQTLKKSYRTKYPKHQKTGGKPYGLSILINPEVEMYSTCTTNDAWGFKMLAHSPISFPSIMEYGAAVPPNSEVFIQVEPDVITAESNLKSVNLKKRACYMSTDPEAKLQTYKIYTADNCKDECIAAITYERCKCVRYFMPRNSSQKMCGSKHLDCAEKVRMEVGSLGKASYCSRCLPSCNEIIYKMQMSHFPLRKSAASVFQYNTSLEDIKLASNYSIVHIFLGTDSLYAKERKRLYVWADMLASAGGILSLTLGFSIISLIEVFYFCTLRAWLHFRPEVKDLRPTSCSNSGVVKLSVTFGRKTTSQIQNDSLTNYYNWLSTSPVATKQLAVEPANSSIKKHHKIPDFNLLANPTQTVYPYVA
ncbi:unnamed protein product [Orchesella dallaii]|uniref:Pickpocket protein 28 n=1 Tax=Orchesella dallaii TaxID=48710 RepID=A0ABP1PPZ1_9HEXA